MLNALIITGDKVQDHEFIYPYYRLQEENYRVDVATKNAEIVYGYYGTRIEATCDIALVTTLDIHFYDLLVLPGGAKAIEYIRQDSEVISYIEKFHNEGGVIASICHGAQLLISAGLVNSKVISGYYSIKDDILNAGGIWSDGPVEVDQRIITSPHYKHLGSWMKKVLRAVLLNKESQED